ncbi:thiaminase II [Acidianus manzaensis]|uniref:Thiaminase II n=1 Tax=Acidianus manzaensis TaxID=282676 RepID=A0A1W6JX49_9CREN|nr:thiaminase II [Acidianus manzaensis]ARM74871.1 thiaminase II [Acidianus manzaensis]
MLTDKMWNKIKDVYEGILSHPFIIELTKGTLHEDKFKYYIIQDHLYLREFGKVLALLSSKAEKEEDSLLFASHLNSIMRVEKELHNFFLKEWKINIEDYVQSPTNMLYTSFLISTAYSRPYFEGVASVLPCYWIYMNVGKELIKIGSPNPLYNRWINTYGGEEYEKGVIKVLEIVNSFKLTEEQEKCAIEKFRIASIFEYMFWDSAYKLEKFPFSLRNPE